MVRMYTTIYLLISSIITCLVQGWAFQNPDVAAREVTGCRVGEPGGVLIHVFTPGEGPSYPKEDYDTPYSAQEATGCLTADHLREHAAGSQKNHASVTNISPDLGGHCMLYSTRDCAGNSVMSLPNPRHLNLAFPDKIICPGVPRDMVPDDFQAIKCFNYTP